MHDLVIVRKTLRDLRWHVLGFGIGIGLTAALLILIYPSYSESLKDVQLPSFYESLFGEGITDFSSPRNFVQLEYFSWIPILLAVFAIISGTGALGGEEGAGTLELLLSQPLGRRALLLAKLAGLVLAAFAIHVLASIGFLLSAPFIDLKGDVSSIELTAATFSSLPFTIAFVALSILVAALTPTRGLAAGLMTVVTVSTYLMNVFADLVPGLDWLRYINPLYYSDAQQVLTEGVVWWHQALLLAGAAVLVGVALAAFERREIGTGRSPLWALLGRDGSRGVVSAPKAATRVG